MLKEDIIIGKQNWKTFFRNYLKIFSLEFFLIVNLLLVINWAKCFGRNFRRGFF